MFKRRALFVRLCSTTLALLALSACGGKSALVPPGSGGQPQSVDQNLTQVVIKVRPQPVEQATWNAAGRGISALSDPLSLLPAVSGGRTASFDPGELTKDASAFDLTLPNQNIATVGLGASFAPNWVDGAGSTAADLAYGVYRFNLQDYATSGEVQSVRLDWAGLGPKPGMFWIGLGNFSGNAWDWYAPDDEVLTIDSLTPYTNGSGEALICVVLLGTEALGLDQVLVGAPEVRGLGATEEPPATQDDNQPPLAEAGTLPSSVNLRPSMPNVRSQGGIGSCTAFAARNAYGYVLNVIWGPYGWDDTKDQMRLAPRWAYNQNNNGCPDGGYSSAALAPWLVSNGMAMEDDVPYGNGDKDDYDCGLAFGAGAYADAAVTKPDSFQSIGISGDAGIQNIKQVLAWQHKPVVFGTKVNQAFQNLDDDSVWTFSGSSSGYHAMCIAGYDDGKGAFYVANSWGYGWGDNGYCWVGYSHFQNSGNLSNPNGFYYIDTVDLDTGGYYNLSIPALYPPRNLKATDGAHNDMIRVTWESVPGATHYELYRDEETNKIADLSAGATSYDDLGVPDNLGHVYFLRAFADPFEPQMSSGDIGYKAGDPDAQFVSPTSGAQGSIAVFSATVVGTQPIDYAWDFGGGATPNASTDPSPAVLLGTQGSYACTLTVSGPSGMDIHNFTLVVDFPASVWTHTFGGNGDEEVNSVFADALGNTYVAGTTDGFGAGNLDIMVARYDTGGNLNWVRSWGGTSEDIGVGVVADSFGHVFVAGRTGSYGVGNYDAVLIKFAADGTYQWAKTWGGPQLDQAHDLGIDAANGIYLAGSTQSFGQGGFDAALLRFDIDGNVVAQRTWGGAGWELARTISVSADGNKIYLGCDVPWGQGAGDVAVLRYNHNLNRTWTRTVGDNQEEFAHGIAQDAEGNAFLTLSTKSSTLGDQAWAIASYAPNGAQRWQLAGGDSNGQDNFPTGIAADPAGDVYLIQRYEDVISSQQWHILWKFDSFGNEIYARQRDDEADWYFFNDMVASNTGKLHFGGLAFSANSYLWVDSSDTQSGNPSLVEDKLTTGTDGTPAGTVGDAAGATVTTPTGNEDTGNNTTDDFMAILYNPND
jgi:C1A family cysteine protease